MIEIFEFIQGSGQVPKIDREKGILFGVKFLGERSANPPPHNNVYPRECRQSAISVLEGARINIDHPPRTKGGETRPYGDGAGVARNLKETGSGIYGEAHFNPKHPLWEQICWDAENCPQHLGFSIHAQGTSRRGPGGENIVESLSQIHSIDLVSRPATTNGLYESLTAPGVHILTRQDFSASCFTGQDQGPSFVGTARKKMYWRDPNIRPEEVAEAVIDFLADHPNPGQAILGLIIEKLKQALVDLNQGLASPSAKSALGDAVAKLEEIMGGDDNTWINDPEQTAEGLFVSGSSKKDLAVFKEDCFSRN